MAEDIPPSVLCGWISWWQNNSWHSWKGEKKILHFQVLSAVSFLSVTYAQPRIQETHRPLHGAMDFPIEQIARSEIREPFFQSQPGKHARRSVRFHYGFRATVPAWLWMQAAASRQAAKLKPQRWTTPAHPAPYIPSQNKLWVWPQVYAWEKQHSVTVMVILCTCCASPTADYIECVARQWPLRLICL